MSEELLATIDQRRDSIPPEYHAGNVLSDALDKAEADIGSKALADMLEMFTINPGRIVSRMSIMAVQDALKWFRQSVTPAAFSMRIANRIARLRGVPHGS